MVRVLTILPGGAGARGWLRWAHGVDARTAVILPGDRDQPPSAIVGGRLLVAGDGIVDPATDEVIAGLVVSEVTADGVRFRFEGRPFTCPLGGGPPRR